MKKITLILFAGLVLFQSCSSQKAQARYARRNVRKFGVISSTL